MAMYGPVLEKTDEILERLDHLDFLCEQHNIQAELVILGGAGILLLMEMYGRSFRSTRDIDVNLLSASNKEKIHKLLEQTQIEIVGGVIDLPPIEDFKDGEKFKIDSDFQAIKVYVPSIELLACTKIFSKREKDLRDLKETSVLNMCDKYKLMKMVEEYKENMFNPNDMDVNVHELTNILEEKGI
jgi:hypothetical protein